MNKSALMAATAVSVLLGAVAYADEIEGGFDTVREDGTFSMPDADFRKDWTMLGAWVLGGSEEPASGIHNVYAQPEAVEAFREDGVFPDGTILIKELLGIEHGNYTTGPASFAGEVEGWFMMIKDGQNRYPDSALWGKGWGWSFFNPDDQETSPTMNYEDECFACHIPAEETDWIYTEAYPVLHTEE